MTYLPYQEDGIRWAADRASCLIGDEMGLGKTVQAIGWLNAHPEIETVLVVCPCVVRLNWEREMSRWLVSPCVEVTVINYDRLHQIDLSQTWDLAILDESHYIKTPEARRSKLCRQIKARRRIALTGTPVLNRPMELWHQLHFLLPDQFPLSSRIKFGIRYCGGHQRQVTRSRKVWMFDGATNLDELREILRPIMIRRRKAEVLLDLPPKRRQVIEIPVEDRRLRHQLALEASDYDRAALAHPERAEALMSELASMSRLRQEAGLAKVWPALEHLEAALEGDGKIVVFAHHRAVIESLRAGLADYGALAITGDTPMRERQQIVDLFQMPESGCRVVVGQIQAAGVGITLTASSHVVFVELDWTPGNMAQAEDRCHRIGQKNSVLVQYLELEGSLDCRMAKSLVRKQTVIDKALTQ